MLTVDWCKLHSGSIDYKETRVKTHMVLRGHRSIVNNVRYNPLTCCLASSGVEKTIKVRTLLLTVSSNFFKQKNQNG